MSRKAPESPASGGTTDHIFIEGAEIAVERREIPIGAVVLDPGNSRIQQAVRQKTNGGKPLTQEGLRDLILDLPGVSDLFKAIRDNRGLMEPIHVRADGRVIEGNCRAATYMRLHNTNKADQRWQRIPVLVVPKITERQVAVLQGQFHVAGKNKWDAYEKAGHLLMMRSELKMEPKTIAKALGMQERVVTRLLDAYGTMRDKVLPRIKNGRGVDKWSYVEELYKIPELEDYRKDDRNVEQFVTLVIDQKFKHGYEVRDLPKLLKNERAMKVLRRDGFNEAMAVVAKTDPTANSAVFRKVKELTEVLKGLESSELQRLRDERKAQQMLKELSGALKNVAKTAGFAL